MANAFDYVFPVIGYEKNAAGDFEMCQIYGTAFSIGEDLYLTAGHSLTEASQHEAAALGRMAGGLIGANQIREREILTDSDLAVCQADVPAEKPLAWQTDELGMLTSVRATGYPYALDLGRGVVHIRARRGEIGASRTFDLLPARPRVYELSFPCPRGLSGAPLLLEDGGAGMGTVCGVVFSNASTEMVIFGEEERLREAGKEVIDRRMEFVVWGVALQAQSVLTQVFPRLLNGTLGAWLEKHGLCHT